MANFLLIHGAFHGAWCWHKVIPELRARGHRALAIDLPGHGVDRTPTADVTLDGYVARVGEGLDALGESAVLVGHSMGGVVISQAAERFPERLAALVYVTAIALEGGESMMDNPVKASPREFMAGFQPREDGVSIDFDQSLMKDAFYADCSDADIALAETCLVPQSGAVMREPITCTAERWGSVRRAYITCADDRALTLDGQRGMLERIGFDQIVAMAGSHSPFLAQPAALAAHLEGIAASPEYAG
ncbi:MAG: alpha/beta fold hydrolase [Pseudomonadales bacterium]